MRKSRPLIDRFMDRVEPVTESGCWLWRGPVCRAGYGKIGRGRRGTGTIKTHRLSWELFVGEIPIGLNVLHKCDVPCCVNPRHLWIGSHRENVTDKIRKGRARSGVTRGTDNKNAKIGPAEARAIAADDRFQRVIAAQYGISRSNVSSIKRRLTWKHLAPIPEAPEA